jgi:hypothetical protein
LWGEKKILCGNMGWQVEKLLLFIFGQVHAFDFFGWGIFQNNPPTTSTKSPRQASTTTTKTTTKTTTRKNHYNHLQKMKAFSFSFCVFLLALYIKVWYN